MQTVRDCRFSKPYRASLGKRLLAVMIAEFPLSDSERIDAFFAERGYDAKVLDAGQFAVPNSITRES
ncbi:MAG: hypothetical protein ACRC46_04695 [Thermoguttaceae bacterium]